MSKTGKDEMTNTKGLIELKLSSECEKLINSYILDEIQMGGVEDTATNDNPDDTDTSVAVDDVQQKSVKKTDDSEMVTKEQLFTIDDRTELFHGSENKGTFDPNEIKLGDDHLIAYFFATEQGATSDIQKCKSNKGYIHKFSVKEPIKRIFGISQLNVSEVWNDPSKIENMYCNSKSGKIPYDGIGFKTTSGIKYALCDPSKYLEYVNTKHCIAPNKLSSPYSFSDGDIED